MVNNSININKTNNYFSTQIIEQNKNHDKWRLDRHKYMAGLNRILELPPSHLINWSPESGLAYAQTIAKLNRLMGS